MDIHREPNLIIFRIPDSDHRENEWDNGFRLVEIPYLGGKLHEQGTIFLPHQHDEEYRSLELKTIVLARKTAEGARELGRYALTADDGNPKAVYLMRHEEMKKAVNGLIKVYNDEQELFEQMQKLVDQPKFHKALLNGSSAPYSIGIGLNSSNDYSFILQLSAEEFWLPDGEQQVTYDGSTYSLIVSRNYDPPQIL